MKQLLTTIVAAAFTSLACAAADTKPPNIIVIYTDDHGYADLGIQGAVADLKTPNVDALARSGALAMPGRREPAQWIPLPSPLTPVNDPSNLGTGHGEYGDPGPQYAIDLHDETLRQKDNQPLPYELLRQLCMGDAPKEELYDLETDPWGVKNLIADPAQANTLARLRQEFADWRQATGDRDVHPKTIARRTQK